MSEPRNNVSCRNINIIAKYVAERIGSDIALFANLPQSVDYLKNENHWIPLPLYNQIMERAIDLLKDPNAPYEMGRSALKLQSWGIFRYLQEIFLSVIYGPIEAYKRFGGYNTHFNKTKDLEILEPKEDSFLLKITFRNGVNPVDDFYSERFIEGLIASVPENWGLEAASVTATLKEYNLPLLLRNIGGAAEDDIEIRDCGFFLKGIEIGKRVRITPRPGTHDFDIAGECSDPRMRDPLEHLPAAILIKDDIEINKQLTLKKGELYNAPYFLYRVSWQPMSLGKKLKHFLLYQRASRQSYIKGMETSLKTIQDYVETLEEKVIDRTRQLNEAKSEAEYWREKADSLLYTMLPQRIVKAMMTGKLRAERIEASVMYTDLAGFTAYSRNRGAAEIEQDLTTYFTAMSQIILKHGGWVNKFLGDGILVIFGLDHGPEAAKNAAAAGIEMQALMQGYPWGMRIGIATGPFIAGEFGTDTLRRFDCVGHTMNLGSRLQSFAEVGEVLVCPETRRLLEGVASFRPPRRISPKGIGEIDAYPLASLTKGS